MIIYFAYCCFGDKHKSQVNIYGEIIDTTTLPNISQAGSAEVQRLRYHFKSSFVLLLTYILTWRVWVIR